MKKQFAVVKRYLSLFITLSMLLTAAVSCSGQSGGARNESAAVDRENETLPSETERELTVRDKLDIVLAGIPKADYGGYAFTVLDRSDAKASLWFTRDVLSESLNGEPINDAVHERNRLLEETLNIRVAENKQQTPETVAKSAILAGDDSFDVLTTGLSQLAPLVKSGYLADLHGVPGLNLDKDWWDANIVTGMSVAKRLYYATGDISIMDNYGTWAVTFNKDLIAELNLDDPYKLFGENKWTLPKMHEMSIAAAADLNGDGVMGDEDRYGSGTESFNVYAYWVGAGQKIITKDNDDLPVLTMNNETSVTVLERVLEFQNDKSITTSTSRRGDGKYMYILFRDNYLLFGFVGMMTLSHYRESEVDYGLITAPKYSEDQENYHNSYSHANFTAYSVPKTASDPARTGAVLDAMAAISKYTLSYAYYDVVLSNKQLRDEESRAMVDLILATRSYDLGPVYNWGGCFSLITGLFDAPSNTFSSKYAAAEEKILAEIKVFIDSLPE